jgi:hypothetical protein
VQIATEKFTIKIIIMNKDSRILIACEESQIVTTEFRKLGFYNTFSCDLLPTSGGHPEWHLQQDVFEVINKGWDMMIAFPPCTHLAVSGAAWFAKKRESGVQREAIDFFMSIINSDCSKIVVENPIGIISGEYIGKHFPDLKEKYNLPLKQTQIVQPWQFGDEFQKSTCLWIKGLPSLEPTNIVGKGEFKEWICPKTGKKKRQALWFFNALKDSKTPQERSMIRSKTFPGIAKAMANQWSEYLLKTK